MQCCTDTAQPVGLVNIPYMFILCLYTYVYNIYINTLVTALQTLHYGKACAVGVAIEAAPPTMEQTSSMPGVCTCIIHHPRTYHSEGTPAVRQGDILPSAFRDHGLNSEGVPGLHHPNGLVLCRQQWCRWRAAAVRYVLACRPWECVFKRCVCMCVCVRACVCVCVCVFSHHMGCTIQRQQHTKGTHSYSYRAS